MKSLFTIALSLIIAGAMAQESTASLLPPTPRPTATAATQSAPHEAGQTHSAGPLDFGTILARYRAALSTYHTPETLTFIFTIDQAGDRGLSQTHLVYRSGLMVRDETTAMGSVSIKPHIHIYRSRAHHYSIEILAPKTMNYRFKYLGARNDAGRLFYRFSTTALNGNSSFSVTEVEIDGARFLPTSMNFRARAANIDGTGHLRYGPVDDAWVLVEATASSHTNKGALREHLVFSEYHFPKNLPPSTFGASLP